MKFLDRVSMSFEDFQRDVQVLPSGKGLNIITPSGDKWIQRGSR